MLANKCSTSCSVAASRRVAVPARSLTVVRAEEPRARVTREYREDSGEVTGPNANKNSDKAMFVDEIPRQKPKSNLSPEMKAKLRAEYTGLGGAEGKAMGGNYFLYIILFMSTLVIFCKVTGVIDF